MRRRPVLLLALPALAACEQARLPVEAGFGPNPTLPPPSPALLPTVNIAKPVGWGDAMPSPAPGLAVTPFARGLTNPRNLLVLPNGDVLVAESGAPPRRPAANLRRRIARMVMGAAGAGRPSANRITLLRDADGDGIAETRSTLLEGLNSPYGMALIGDALFVADTDAIRRFPFRPGMLRIDAPGTVLAPLPAGPINAHWTKNLLPTPDGKALFVAIGSNSDHGERGLENEADRAMIWRVDIATGAHRVYASGLRNPVGMALAPGPAPMLWTVVNERDELGSDLVPDYLTAVRDGGFYGWPWSYFGQRVDTRVDPPNPEAVARAIAPDYALGAHTASLGLVIAAPSGLPAPFAAGAFIGQHGSWNRRPPSGYKVVFVPFAGARPSGPPQDVLTGFLEEEGRARGRPVGVALDGRGGLLVADDLGDTVWRVRGA
jgi:glucose/arabinose dehydrogenase